MRASPPSLKNIFLGFCVTIISIYAISAWVPTLSLRQTPTKLDTAKNATALAKEEADKKWIEFWGEWSQKLTIGLSVVVGTVFILSFMVLGWWVISMLHVKLKLAKIPPMVENKIQLSEEQAITVFVPADDPQKVYDLARDTTNLAILTVQQANIAKSQQLMNSDELRNVGLYADALRKCISASTTILKHQDFERRIEERQMKALSALESDAEEAIILEEELPTPIIYTPDVWHTQPHEGLNLGVLGHDFQKTFGKEIVIKLSEDKTQHWLIGGDTTSGKTEFAKALNTQLKVIYGAKLWVSDLHWEEGAENKETLLTKMKEMHERGMIDRVFGGEETRTQFDKILWAFMQEFLDRKKTGIIRPYFYLTIEEVQECLRLFPKEKKTLASLITQLRKFGMGLICLSSDVTSTLIPSFQGFHNHVMFKSSTAIAERMLHTTNKKKLLSATRLLPGQGYYENSLVRIAEMPFIAYYNVGSSAYLDTCMHAHESSSRKALPASSTDTLRKNLIETGIMTPAGIIPNDQKLRLHRHSFKRYSEGTWALYLSEYLRGTRQELPPEMWEILNSLFATYLGDVQKAA